MVTINVNVVPISQKTVMNLLGCLDKHALHAWIDHEDKHNTLPSSANKLGGGEAPAATCGFEIDHTRFQPFGCVGTVNVLYKNLVSMRSLTQERFLWIKYLAQRIPVM